jgi:hypothetical protein
VNFLAGPFIFFLSLSRLFFSGLNCPRVNSPSSSSRQLTAFPNCGARNNLTPRNLHSHSIHQPTQPTSKLQLIAKPQPGLKRDTDDAITASHPA